MGNRSSEQTGCDRRILKAFYTQYVAVLLIMLVFSVGAFQRTSALSIKPAPIVPVIVERPSIGSFDFTVEFDSAGSLVRTSDDLDAIADVIREHDVKAIVTLAVSNGEESGELREVEGAMARLDSIKGYLESRGVSESDARFYVGGPEARPGRVVVHFEEVSHDNLPL
jgi:hypothetical protein